MVATCPDCGAEYSLDTARFCGSCGARREAADTDPDTAENPNPPVPDAHDHAAEVENYLAASRPLVDGELDRLDELAAILDGTYATRETWRQAIAETFRPGAELAEHAAAIDPPAGYEAAHATLVTSL